MDSSAMPVWDLIVIGGGASGMSAAIAYQRACRDARKEPGTVLILEKNDRVGKKILATGNGRCNLSNKDMQFSHFHSHEKSFPSEVLDLVPQKESLIFLEEHGILTTAEGNKMFPVSKTSSSVVDAFRFALDDYDISLIEQSSVTEIKKEENFIISTLDEQTYQAKQVIVACGGACAASLGTTGDGYRWLSQLGHRVYAPKPSIVQIVTENAVTKALSGLKLECDLSLIAEDVVVARQFGEVLFADYGLSGPAVFQVSGEVSRRMKKNQLSVPMKVTLQLFDEATLRSLRSEMIRRREAFADRTLDHLLLSILPAKIGNMILKTALHRPLSLHIASLSDADLDAVIRTLRIWSFDVIGTRSLEYAQTTIGGADCSEFDPKTLESKIVSGLYGCGEVLDVDGDCGGYNLQWAFSSGILAGRSAYARAFGGV